MRYNSTERIGVNAVERIVLEELKWIFREQPIADVGIDALIEIVHEETPLCKFIGTQIKSGKGNFYEKEKHFTYYASDIHYNYWTNANIPIILVGYIPEHSTAYWIEITPENFIRNKRQWKIDIPKKQKFNTYAQSRLLSLVDSESFSFIQQKWTIEKINGLTERSKAISQSTQYINKFSEHLRSVDSAHIVANEKFRELISQQKNLKDPQTKLVINDLTSSMKYHIPLMEEAINKFSKLYATGIDALHELVVGCKELNLEDVLMKILPMISTLPSAAEKTILKIESLKETVDKFSKNDKELKKSTIILSEVLGLVKREFQVASDLTRVIIRVIKE